MTGADSPESRWPSRIWSPLWWVRLDRCTVRLPRSPRKLAPRQATPPQSVSRSPVGSSHRLTRTTCEHVLASLKEIGLNHKASLFLLNRNFSRVVFQGLPKKLTLGVNAFQGRRGNRQLQDLEVRTIVYRCLYVKVKFAGRGYRYYQYNFTCG